MKKSNRGSVLMLTMLFLVILSTLASVTWSVTGTTTKNTTRFSSFYRSTADLEAKLEYAYGIWSRRITEGKRPITTGSANMGLGNNSYLVGSNFTKNDPDSGNYTLSIYALDEYGVPLIGDDEVPVGVEGGVPGYDGWRGLTFKYLAEATTLLDPNDPDSKIGIRRTFEYAQVPLFQTTYFSEPGFQLVHPAKMRINGLIHSNGDAYVTAEKGNLEMGASFTFSAGQYESLPSYMEKFDEDLKLLGPQYVDGGEAKQRAIIRPLGPDLDKLFKDPANSTNPDLDGGYRELIEPPVNPSTDPVGERRVATSATVRMTVTVDNDLNVTVAPVAQNGETMTGAARDSLKACVSASATQIYEPKEGKRYNFIDFDISKLKDTIENVGGISNFEKNAVIYIYTPTLKTNSDNPTIEAVNSIRLINGAELPKNSNGLTIGTVNPLYIKGNYNTGTGTIPSNENYDIVETYETTNSDYKKKPAAVLADAVTFLSNNWNDAESAPSLVLDPDTGKPIPDLITLDLQSSNRKARNTTYNVAILAGSAPRRDPDDKNTEIQFGGSNNLMRLIEDWKYPYEIDKKRAKMTYCGSLVELFESQISNSKFVFPKEGIKESYYLAANRQFTFEDAFRTNRPPGKFDGVILTRGSWQRF